MPDIIHIFLDSSVRCELTSACCVQHSHTSPAFFIFVGFFHFLLCCCIGTEISKDKVLVCSFSTVLVKKRIVQVTEQFCIRRECSIDKLCQHLTDLIICIVDNSRIISTVVFIVDYFVCAQTKDKCVFFANFINDLNVSAIHGSKCRCTVQHELHVTCTGSFFTCCRDLLRYICCCKDHLSVGYTIVLDEYNFQLAFDRCIIVYNICYRVDQFNDFLSTCITCRCFCTEDECSWIKIHFRMFLNLVIQIDYMQDVQKLTFVLMKSLNLYIEDRTWIYLYSVVLQDIFCQTNFVLVFDVHEFLLCFFIININFQFADLRQICDPFRSDMICYPVCKKLVSVKQETSLCDTVCLVVEFLRHHFIEIFQFLFLKDFCMKFCNTVYRVTCNDCKMSHFYLSIIEDCHLLDLVIISRIFSLNVKNETAIDLFDDLVYTWKQSGEQLNRPFLKSLCHDCMVCVSNTFSCYRPCIIPSKSFFVHKDTHKFCYCYCRMSIVHLESNFFVQFHDIFVVLFVFINSSLKTCRYKEILLFQTQLFTSHMVVVRIKNFYDIAGKVFLLNCFFVITFIERVKLEVYDWLCIPDS